MKFILGKKINMTQIFRPDGEVVPVTRVSVGPCQIVQIKDNKKENSMAVQLGFGAIKIKQLGKTAAGHFKGLEPARHLVDFPVQKIEGLDKGDMVMVETFVPGDKVTVIGESKGKGFQGVVKRHHFHGGPASHGHKDNLRAPGSIGAAGVQRVFKGMRMAGRMGGERVTIKNLEIVEVRPDVNELYIKGALPGGRNSVLCITAEGDLKITKKV